MEWAAVARAAIQTLKTEVRRRTGKAEPEILTWILIRANGNVQSFARPTHDARNEAGGVWLCVYHYPSLGKQVYAFAVCASPYKLPPLPSAILPADFQMRGLLPMALVMDKWRAALAGPLLKNDTVGAVQQRAHLVLRTMGPICKSNADWTQLNVCLPAAACHT
jgi:hypothetical protein